MNHPGRDRRSADRIDLALPPASTRRWVISRKAQIVRAVEVGVLSEEAACARYDLSIEELDSWRRLVEQHGVRGLRVTRVQEYREPNRSEIK